MARAPDATRLRRALRARDPVDGRYETVASLTDADVVTAARLPLTVAVTDLLPPRR